MCKYLNQVQRSVLILTSKYIETELVNSLKNVILSQIHSQQLLQILIHLR